MPCQKVPKSDFQSEFSMSKIIRIFLIFFSMKNKGLGAHFLLKSFFCNFNFKTPLLLKSCSIFDETTKLCKASEDVYNRGGWPFVWMGRQRCRFRHSWLLWIIRQDYWTLETYFIAPSFSSVSFLYTSAWNFELTLRKIGQKTLGIFSAYGSEKVNGSNFEI